MQTQKGIKALLLLLLLFKAVYQLKLFKILVFKAIPFTTIMLCTMERYSLKPIIQLI